MFGMRKFITTLGLELVPSAKMPVPGVRSHLGKRSVSSGGKCGSHPWGVGAAVRRALIPRPTLSLTRELHVTGIKQGGDVDMPLDSVPVNSKDQRVDVLNKSSMQVYDGIAECYRGSKVGGEWLLERIKAELIQCQLDIHNAKAQQEAPAGDIVNKALYATTKRLIALARRTGIKEVIRLAYSHAIYLFGLYGDHLPAQLMFDEMEPQSFLPSEAEYTSLMNAYANAGDLARALETFTRLKENTAGVDPYPYTILIKLYAKLGRLEDAVEVFGSMKERMSPTIREYNTLIRACFRLEDFGKATRVYQDMVTHGVQPNANTFSMLILLAKSKAPEKAKDLHEEMLRHKVTPTIGMAQGLLAMLSADPAHYPTAIHIHRSLASHQLSISALSAPMVRGAQANRSLKDARLFFSELVRGTVDSPSLLVGMRALFVAYAQAFKPDRRERFHFSAPASVDCLAGPVPSSMQGCVSEAKAIEAAFVGRLEDPNLVRKSFFYVLTNYNYLEEATAYFNLHFIDRPLGADPAILVALLRMCTRIGKEDTFRSHLKIARALLAPIASDSRLGRLDKFDYARGNALRPYIVNKLYQAIVLGLARFGDLHTALDYFEELTLYPGTTAAKDIAHYRWFFDGVSKAGPGMQGRLEKIKAHLRDSSGRTSF